MLYKFKSKSTGDLIMLQPDGRRVLQIIGKDASPGGVGESGIILPEQMPDAIAALEAAIAQDEADKAAATAAALAAHKPRPHFEEISLRLRATPFIDVLRECARHGNFVVWGV